MCENVMAVTNEPLELEVCRYEDKL